MTPWFPLFGRDFLAATTGWTAEERGHYMTLLIVQWEQDGLPDDLRRLELISPGLKGCWKTVSTKFPVWKDGKRRNTRLEHERSKSHERSERARQSASTRWASEAVLDGDQTDPDPKPPDPPVECERICDRISERISTRISADDASISMSYSPPPPGGESAAWQQDWPALRAAWNAGDGRHRKPWRSATPPPAAGQRLSEPGWLSEALKAIEHLPRCRRFTTAVSLPQFLQAGWAARVLGGEFDDQIRQAERQAGPGDRPPPQSWSGADAAAFEATKRREAARARALAGGSVEAP